MTKEQHKALKNSIKHWKRMIAWVKKQPGDEYPDSWDTIGAIGETWSGDYCACCEVSDSSCRNCPIVCGPLWVKVSRTHTWADWLIAAKKLLIYMQDVEAGRCYKSGKKRYTKGGEGV